MIHRLLGYLAVGGVVIGLGWAALAIMRPRTTGLDRWFHVGEWFQAAVVALLVVVAASGLVLVLAGGRPADGLHLLYAGLAIGAVPAARSFAGRASGRSAAVAMLAAFLVLAVLLYRLFTTG